VLEKSLKKTAVYAYYIAPSAVSCFRVLLALALVFTFNDLTSVFIGCAVGIVFGLDALDGILARWLNSQSLIGSFIDIFCDRAVELIFLQCFVRSGLVPFWFVLVFYGRVALTDGCRMRAFKMNKMSAMGIYLARPWRFLVLSKWSRSLYGGLKGVFFGLLLLAVHRGARSLSQVETVLMWSVLIFSVLRAWPILLSYFPNREDLVGSQGDKAIPS
jgi:phosphatidylglycerophosphate synthase